MKIGVAPLTVALLVMTSRLTGSAVAADLFALAYLVVASIMIGRSAALVSVVRSRS